MTFTDDAFADSAFAIGDAGVSTLGFEGAFFSGAGARAAGNGTLVFCFFELGFGTAPGVGAAGTCWEDGGVL